MFSFCSNVEKVREFIKNVYVEKRYAGGNTSDMPPKDMQAITLQPISKLLIL